MNWQRMLFVGIAATANLLVAQNAAAPATTRESTSASPGYCKVSIKVRDGLGAYVSGAHIVITDLARGAVVQKDASALGEAEFDLSHESSYKIGVSATGFTSYVETFRVEADVVKTFSVTIDPRPIIDWVDADVGDAPPIQVEHSLLEEKLPYQPLELMPPQSKPIRKHRRWL